MVQYNNLHINDVHIECSIDFHKRKSNNIQSELSGSKDELLLTSKSLIHHELRVIKSDENNYRDEMNDRVTEAQKEIIRLRGKVASLSNEKNQLLKRVSALEDKCEELVNKFSSKDPTTNNVISDQSPKDNSNENKFNDFAPEHSTDQQGVETNIPMESTTKPTHNTKNVSAPDTITSTPTDNPSFPTYDFVMLCDSNRRFLDINKLCYSTNCKMIASATTQKATEIINSPRFMINKGIIINTGVNDVEHMSAEQIIEDQVKLIEIASSVFPEKKIIVSEITPRTDGLDDVVLAVNNGVHKRIKDLPNVNHVDNDNLREYRFFHDTKHLNRRLGIPMLAKNLKSALRSAVLPKQQPRSSYAQKSKRVQKRNQPHPTTMKRATPVQRPPPVNIHPDSPLQPLPNQPPHPQYPPQPRRHPYNQLPADRREPTSLNHTVKEQLQNMNILLNNFVSIFKHNYSHHQGVMYNQLPINNSNTLYNRV